MSRFESLTPWSRTWVLGVNFVVTQSFKWCFDRLILAQSRQYWRNVNPQLQPQVSDMKLGLTPLSNFRIARDPPGIGIRQPRFAFPRHSFGEVTQIDMAS